jgi:uncharacterized protein YraI
MKKIVLLLAIAISLHAKISYKDALFGKVVGVANWDRLNVRVKPNYKSKKVASLPNGAYVGIYMCKKLSKSIWCKIHHIAQHDYEGFEYNAKSGWVNAKYLKLSDKGYVLVNKKANCYYVTGCKNGLCDLVVSYKQDKDYNIVSLKTKKVKRSSLKAESNFGAANPNEDGYCTEHQRIEDYLKRK